jgi:hypothetical protein
MSKQVQEAYIVAVTQMQADKCREDLAFYEACHDGEKVSALVRQVC